jgi:hypothetical protein
LKLPANFDVPAHFHPKDEADRRSPPQRGGVDAIVPESRQLVV